MRFLPILAALGLTGCAAPATDEGLAILLKPHVADLRAALEDNPDTPDAVAEPAVNIVLGFEAVVD